ncbi:MAG: glycosyltransferase family 4 protein [Candidatus Goldiibacteriota bacterium]
MKVMFVSHSAVLKEYQQKLVCLAENHGIDIVLVTPPYWYESGVKTRPFKGYKQIKYETGRVVFLKKYVHFYKKALKTVKRLNPDIIHIEEEPFDIPCMQFMRAAKKTGKKTVFFTSDNFKRKHNAVRQYFDSYCLKNTDGVAAVNLDAKKLLVERGCSEEKIEIIAHGINPEEFSFAPGISGKKNYTLGYTGRIAPEKGLETVIDAVSGINNVKFIMAGAGEKDYENSLKKRAEEKGVLQRIEFRGHINRSSIPAFMTELDVFVLPSLTTKYWREKFGRVIIESFASKVPVIGSDSGEIPNLLKGAGMIFMEGDSAELKDKILRLTGDMRIYQNCRDKGYEKLMNNYTNDKIAEKLAGLYTRIMK